MTKILLKTSHIYLESDLVETIFGKIHYAYVQYLENRKCLLITPVSSQWFTKLYKPTQFLLKSRNLKGDKTLAIREILIDNNIETHDRALECEIDEKLQMIRINL